MDNASAPPDGRGQSFPLLRIVMRKFLAFLAVIAVAACDTRVGGSFVAPQTPSIVGSRFVTQSLDGQALPALYSQTSANTISLVADTLTFSTDGKTVTHVDAIAIATPPGSTPVTQPASSETGTFTLSNGVLTLLFVRTGGTAAFTGTQSGATITLNDGHAYVYRKL